jgi:hypothetical protein
MTRLSGIAEHSEAWQENTNNKPPTPTSLTRLRSYWLKPVTPAPGYHSLRPHVPRLLFTFEFEARDQIANTQTAKIVASVAKPMIAQPAA